MICTVRKCEVWILWKVMRIDSAKDPIRGVDTVDVNYINIFYKWTKYSHIIIFASNNNKMRRIFWKWRTLQNKVKMFLRTHSLTNTLPKKHKRIASKSLWCSLMDFEHHHRIAHLYIQCEESRKPWRGLAAFRLYERLSFSLFTRDALSWVSLESNVVLLDDVGWMDMMRCRIELK